MVGLSAKSIPPLMINAIVLAMDEEGMEMGIRPAHDELQNIMEIGNGAVAANKKASPNHGTNSAQPHAKLIRCIGCSPFAHAQAD